MYVRRVWREAAQKASKWCRRVEDGVEAFTQKWHDAGRRGGVMFFFIAAGGRAILHSL